ncbi:MAG: hypothetical protein ACKO4T_02945 [Planctomycetaceae bacterium]
MRKCQDDRPRDDRGRHQAAFGMLETDVQKRVVHQQQAAKA